MQNMILVDTSCWVSYFNKAEPVCLSVLLEQNMVLTNDIILSELLPIMRIRKQNMLCALLNNLPKCPLSINWAGIIDMQEQNILNGINKVGIPDIIIAQNAMQWGMAILTYDKHFSLMADLFGFSLYNAR